MEAAKIIRKQRKSVLNRHIITLTRLVIEEDISSINSRLSSMKITFEELETSHYSYVEYLESDSSVSSSDLDQCNEWFSDITKSYLDEVTKARLWLRQNGISMQTVNVDSQGTKSQVAGLSEELATHLSLPKISIPTFSGDPREYHLFITTFDQVVGDVLSSDQAKLTRLYQYLAGEAQSSVKSFMLIGGATGYAKARSVLKSRFGSSHLVAQSIIDDLRQGKSAIRSKDLRTLADDVTTAHITLTKIGAYGEVNTQQFIIEILSRCHTQLRSSWRKYALDNHETKNTYPTFEQFAAFLDKAARGACDPVYGFDAYKTSSKSANVNLVSESALGFNVEQCPACQGSHDLSKCDHFRDMGPEQRLQTARSKRLCYSCLARNHMVANCPKTVECSIDGCNRLHNRLLHVNRSYNARPSMSREGGKQYNRPYSANAVKGPIVDGNVNICSSNKRVYLPLITVLINSEPVLALLDPGSTNTLISKRLADKLNLKGKSMICSLNTVGINKPMQSKLVSIKISSVDNEVAYNAEHVFVIPEIPAEVPRGDITLTDYPHLADLPISQLVEGTKADVLIGNDHPDLLVPHDVRRSVSRVGQPYATLTRLGWVLQGPVMESRNNPNRMSVHHVSLGEIDYSVQKLWEIEHENETTSSWSVEDKRVHDMWNNDTVYADDRYTIPIPWRPGRPCFPNNRYLAVKRLDSTLKKLKMNGMYGMYEENVCKLLTDGHAELVPSESLSRDDNKVWYLPHHGVTTDSKPDKVRMVFDCAAKYGGMSLNSECFQGPDICNKLLHVLLRFRRYEYAITADVHTMYLQVRIPEVDRDCLRFLWQHSGTDDIVEYRMTSHLFGGVWCASSSTYALRRTLDYFDANDSVRYAVSKAMYVDDLLTSLATRDEAVSLVTDVNDTLMKGGFNLTKFIANDVTVMSQIPEDKRAKEAKVITNEIHSKALGIKWDVSKDQFSYVRKAVAWLLRWVHGFKPNQSMNGKRLTARELMKAQTLLVNRSQEASYYNEIQCLSKGNPVNRSSDIISLDPVINNGQLVVGGRLKHAPLSDSNCHQVIISPRHVLSRLILVEAHGKAHLGTEWVLSLVRIKYWIPGARNILRGIRMKCVTCQRLYGKPRVQKMADLPPERCTPGPLGFQHVGVDLFGPFYVVQGRSSIKRYGCVFTCFSIRAIHIEVLASLETDSFINGFCRFCARRGRPRTIRSDNGTNLVGASVEMAR